MRIEEDVEKSKSTSEGETLRVKKEQHDTENKIKRKRHDQGERKKGSMEEDDDVGEMLKLNSHAFISFSFVSHPFIRKGDQVGKDLLLQKSASCKTLGWHNI